MQFVRRKLKAYELINKTGGCENEGVSRYFPKLFHYIANISRSSRTIILLLLLIVGNGEIEVMFKIRVNAESEWAGIYAMRR